jgi:hypothetical protein
MIRPKNPARKDKEKLVLLLRMPLRTLFWFGAARGRGQGGDRAAPSVRRWQIRARSGDRPQLHRSCTFTFTSKYCFLFFKTIFIVESKSGNYKINYEHKRNTRNVVIFSSNVHIFGEVYWFLVFV